MKIGIFDSGLGGLLIAHSLLSSLPGHDYLYLGDTARVPYGNRQQPDIYGFTLQAVDYLFDQGCDLIVIACNTASAEALRRIQREYLPSRHPDKRVLGVLIPAAEAAVSATKTGRVGVLATVSTVSSGAFTRELLKLNPAIEVQSVAAPLLVPLVESDSIAEASPALDTYLAKFTDIDTLILGCTHYPYLKSMIRHKVGHSVKVITQDEILPDKLADYLERHDRDMGPASPDGRRQFLLTRLTPGSLAIARRLFAGRIELSEIKLPDRKPHSG